MISFDNELAKWKNNWDKIRKLIEANSDISLITQSSYDFIYKVKSSKN